MIPASSIKGAIKAAYEDLFPERNEEIKRLFGSKEEQGICIFTDAYPVRPGERGYVLYPDVMTPHYKGDVLSELEAEPTPIQYISIAPKTLFGFIIAIKRNISGEMKRRFREALFMAIGLGLGAKTMIGYGSFRIIKFDMSGS